MAYRFSGQSPVRSTTQRGLRVYCRSPGAAAALDSCAELSLIHKNDPIKLVPKKIGKTKGSDVSRLDVG